MYLYLYFIWVNAAAALTFAADKRAAVRGRERVPERTLHLLELCGGVWAVLPLMYLLRHKNRKPSYRLWTWAIALGWAAALAVYLLVRHTPDAPGAV